MANFGEGPARFIPVNRQEFENELATIAGKHMGDLQGNPSAWVIAAMRECYQAGFALGFSAGTQAAMQRLHGIAERARRGPATPPPGFAVPVPPEAAPIDPDAWRRLPPPSMDVVRRGRPPGAPPPELSWEVRDAHDIEAAKKAGTYYGPKDRPDPLQTVVAAYHALRSYEHGNSEPELAKRVADMLKKLLSL
jgi:hypothetical protein